jgi:ubiquinone/menaquinone biosynthesis C-methylase UbiE
VSVRENLSFEVVRAGFQEMQRLDIVIAPWLIIGDNTRLQESQHKQLEQFAHELSRLYPDGKVLWFEPYVTPVYLERAYYETLLSTAAYLSYQRLGTLTLTDEMILVAYRLTENFVCEDQGSILLSVHARIMMYLNGQVLDYYDGVPEEVFVSGAWHRPWIQGTLLNELKRGIEDGIMLSEDKDGQLFVKLTDKGQALYEACRQDLSACGYLKQSERLMRAAGFTNMDDYERIVEQMNPNIHRNRQSLLQQSGITAGMKVLELGCGAGALTLDDGLYKVVGTDGSVVATDPSTGMLARARNKVEKYDAPNVTFLQATAESIPFADDSFDAVMGFLFLHFTDIPKAFEEIRRVTRPGGTFSTLYALNLSKSQDFFMEWFAPVFQRGLAAEPQSIMPEETIVPEVAGEYFAPFGWKTEQWEIHLDHVENSVKFLFEIGTMAETNELPWKARQELKNELIQRGYSIKAKYGIEQMKMMNRGQWFHGVVRK